jgi:hypothetical protein
MTAIRMLECDAVVTDGYLVIRPSPSVAKYLSMGIRAKIRILSLPDPSAETFERLYRCVRMGYELCTGSSLELSKEDAEIIGSLPRTSMNSDAIEISRIVAATAKDLSADSGVPILEMDRALKAIVVAHER